MKVIDGVAVWGEGDPAAIEQIRRCAAHDDVVGAALMADHHVGYSVPIGGVLAYGEHVSPSGVGFDIACGIKAVLLEGPSADDVRANIGSIMDRVYAQVAFGVGRKNAREVDHELFDDPAWVIPVAAEHKDMARKQLGTVGSGNHFVDVMVDDLDRIWVMVHFGSRGLGHKIASHYIKAGGGTDGMHVEPVLLHQDSGLGEEYIACMKLAGRYAYAGRDWVCQEVADILGGEIVTEVHNHHNFAWWEHHQGRWVWVVRKGATPAFAGQAGAVGGSMGDRSAIIMGIRGAGDLEGFCSTVHGAGRVMSRTEAAGKYKGWGDKRTQVRPGKISPEMMRKWLDEFGGVELRGGGLDESPHCYKRLDDVLAAHAETTRVMQWLRPLGVAMAGAGEFDPYKD